MRVPTMNGFDNQYALIQSQYETLSRLMMQQGSQKKILQPSDDLMLSNQIKSVQDYISNLGTYQQNNIMSLNRTAMLEGAAKSSVSTTDRIKQLINEAGSDLKSDSDRSAIADELKGLLKDLLNTANRQDGANSYLFSGSNNKQVPYILENGKYVYYGTQDSTTISIGTNVETIYNQSGYLIFDHLMNGNGKFSIKAANTNTGSASTSPGSVVNQSAYVEDNYTISFVTNAAGHLAYQVTGATSGQVIPPPPATIPADAPDYVQDGTVSFNGMNLTISGAPKVGDTFQVEPSKADNVFNSLTDLIKNLKTPIDSDLAKRAQFHQSLSQSSSLFTEAFNRFVGFQSEIGQRSQTIAKQGKVNEDIAEQSQQTLSKLGDVDPYDVQTQISEQMIFIQATQSAYMQIQSVLMNLMKLSI